MIAISFFVLAAHVAVESLRDLLTQDKAGESLVGIVLNAARPGGQGADRDRAAPDWSSARQPGARGAVGGDLAVELPPISLLVGLSVNAAFGLWWADPLVALVRRRPGRPLGPGGLARGARAKDGGGEAMREGRSAFLSSPPSSSTRPEAPGDFDGI